MDREFDINLELDLRSKKRDGTHPLKVRVYSRITKEFKRLKTDFSFTVEDYARVWTLKPRKEFKSIKESLDVLLKEYIERADRIKPFDLTVFSNRLGKNKNSSDLFELFDSIKEANLHADRIGNFQSYQTCQKCIEKFHKASGKGPLTFNKITVTWLNNFDRWMIAEGLSETTRGIYLRTLRAALNTPVNNKAIFDNEAYPFGDKKFVIPTGKSSKKNKALDNEDLKKLLEVTGLTPAQEKARAFWFFSFFSNGMNLKDVALLKWEDLQDDRFRFKRSKTNRTSKKPRVIEVFIESYHLDIIDRYGTNKSSMYLFPIINPGSIPITQDREISNFVISTNKNFQKAADKAGVDVKISSIMARHSYANKAMRKKADPLTLMYSLGHANFSTTEHYLSGFDDETMKGVQSSISVDLFIKK